jgi:hypothetical protein
MATTDRGAARTAASGVVLVAITAAVVSFSHVRSVAMDAGETELTSWLLPISIDSAVVAAVSVLLADSRAGRRPARLTWLLLALGLAASLAANIASAQPDLTARAVAAWPPVALALGIEVLAGLARRSDPEAVESPREFRPWAPDRASAVWTGNGNGTAANGRAAAGMPGTMPGHGAANGLGRKAASQPVVDDEAAVALIRRLDAGSPDGQAPRLEIQRALGCGGSRAARLAGLARESAAGQATV